MKNQHKTRIRIALLLVVLLLAMTAQVAQPVQAQGTDKKERLKIAVELGGEPLDVIKQLREMDLVPGGGKVGMRVARAAMNVIGEGNWFTVISKGTKLKNFVLNYEFRARNMDGETNACGIGFRIVDDDNQSFVMLTKDRHIVLFQVDDGEKIVAFDESVDDLEGVDAADYELTVEQIHIITLIAIDDKLTLFLNGLEMVTIDTAKAVRGGFVTRLYNEEGNKTNTLCAYSTIWAWSYDN